MPTSKLGDGTTVLRRLTPVVVVGGHFFTQPSTGSAYAYGGGAAR